MKITGNDGPRDRAQGCLLGQLIGDALGSLVEFQRPEEITNRYPEGVREIHDGGTWSTLAGQPTDDSELALALARVLVDADGYDTDLAWSAYQRWFESHPFDIGNTVRAAMLGSPDRHSQSNGALMRISPLGIFSAGVPLYLAVEWARADALMTHPNPVAVDSNAVFVAALAGAISRSLSPEDVYAEALDVCEQFGIAEPVRDALVAARDRLPGTFTRQQGWVLIALQNAFFQLLNADDFESALVDTIAHGGDTDTTAAICGALLGAVHGRSAIPARWVETVLKCRPSADRVDVQRPRPEEYWPVDALELADRLLASGGRFRATS